MRRGKAINRYHSSFRNPADNLILIYLLIMGIMLFPFHSQVKGWAVLAVLHLAAFWMLLEGLRFMDQNRSGRVDIVHTLYPLLFVLFSWIGLKFLITMFFADYYGTAIIQGFEKHLFWGEYPTVWIRQWFSPWRTELMNGIYTFYYLLFIGTPLCLYCINQKKMARDMIFIQCLNHIIFITIFLIFPVEGPKTTITAVENPVIKSQVFSNFIRLVQKWLSVRGAAFPSLHVAESFCIGWILIKKWFRIGLFVVLFSLVMILATVYCQYHYAVDGIFALFLSWPVYGLGNWLLKTQYNKKSPN